MADKDGKTEKASPKKRRDERKKGHIFKSQDVVSLCSLIICFYALKIFFPWIYEWAGGMMISCLEMAGKADTGVGLDALGYTFLITAVKCAMPVMLISMLVGVLATGVQTRFLFSAELLKPKFSRLNPLQGIKNLLSVKSLVELLKSILKVIVIVWILYGLIKGDFVQVVRTMDMDLKNSTAFMLDMVMDMVLKLTIVFVAIAVADYFYQWYAFEKDMKMSKEEVKEEYKQTEGNPQIKGRIRNLQRQMARNRMMQAVPNADVIIRNPTHFAVALRYDLEKDRAPVVLAKGQDELALRIVKVGEENGVAVIENVPLARGLFAATDLDREIPEQYYAAVAEILVYVFKINQKRVS